MKIDCHQHFWRFNEEEFGWMNQKMEGIKQDHLPNDLVPELSSIGFDGSVVVQARQSIEETEWLLQLANENPAIKAVVGWVNLTSTDVERQLQKYAGHPKFAGVRHVLHDEPDINFMLHPDFIRGISMLASYNLVYDLLVFPEHLPNSITLVKQFPNQVFVLDHIAKPLISKQILSPWKEYIEALAKLPNIYCKVSGMVTEADWENWKTEDFTPYLDTVFNAFGSKRIMIGSDWPVCKVAGSYSQVMNIVINYIDKLPATEKEMILGGTAEKVYLQRNR